MKKAEVLYAAVKAVGDRGLNYGTPEDNFNRIARLWNAHLDNRSHRSELDASDVAMMMALMKIARLENDETHLDSWIDLAGYAACGGDLTEIQKPGPNPLDIASAPELAKQYMNETFVANSALPRNQGIQSKDYPG